MKKIITLFAIFASTMAFSQVGIGTTSPNENSILDLRATDKGFLLPRLTTTERTALGVTLSTTPDPLEKGMQVYDTDLNAIYFWDGSQWIENAGKNIYTANGALTGNRVVDMPSSRTLAFTPSGTQVVNQFSVDGTTFSVDALNNRVGIGTASPQQQLDVNGNIHIGGASRRILSDFSNSTQAQRTFFQTTTTNGETHVSAIPSGTATGGSFSVFNRTDPDNASRAQLLITNTAAEIRSNANGTGTVIPFMIRMGTTPNVLRIEPSGNIGISNSGPTERLDVNGNIKFSGALMPNNEAGTTGQVLQSAGTGAAPTWTTLTAANTPNIYTADGSISANRIVDMPSSRILAFTPSGTQVVNQFSVDGTTFSVDALNNRVGIGTNAPNASLEVNGSVRFPTVATTNVTGPYNTLGINTATGELGVFTPGASPVLVRSTATIRTSGTGALDLESPINTSASNSINTLGATFGTTLSSREFIQVPEAGTYRIEIPASYFESSNGQSALIHIDVFTAPNNDTWTLFDSPRTYAGTVSSGFANPNGNVVVVKQMSADERVSFRMRAQNSLSGSSGWSKPNTSNNSMTVIITKL